MTLPSQEVSKPKKSKIRILAARLSNRYVSLLPLDKILITVLLLATLGFIGNRIWMALATGGYVMPHSADDWAAWGTWIGGLATAAAFMYTAFQLRDQRANRSEDEAKTFAALEAKAHLVTALLGDAKTTRYYVSHPTQDQDMNSSLLSGAHTLAVFNKSDAIVQNVQIGLTRSFALPPLPDANRPIWTDGPHIDEVMNHRYDVPRFSTGVTPTLSSMGFGQGVHFEIVQPGDPATCALVYENVGERPAVAWIVFTDSSGYTWHRDLVSGALSHHANHQG